MVSNHHFFCYNICNKLLTYIMYIMLIIIKQKHII
nr:MAG TPA: hypothetical protein [Caudoviricetes sp.]